MTDSHRYAMLLTSLPYHGPLFGADQTPLSRIRLDQRLALLDPDDAENLHLARQLMEWARQTPRGDDAGMIAWASATVARLSRPFARDLAIWRLELRTLVAALRLRARAAPAPADARWGFGRWLGRLRRHWSEPAFGLAGVYPWLPEAERLLERGAALELERLLFAAVWNHLERLNDGHMFDFEAVLIYVLRWDLIARWTAQDSARAGRRFDDLANAALAGFVPDQPAPPE